jgi:hypothetical protein
MAKRRFPKRVWVISFVPESGRIERELIVDKDLAERYRTVHRGWVVAEYQRVETPRRKS